MGLVLAGENDDKRMTANVSGSIALDSKIARASPAAWEDPTVLAGYALKAILGEMSIDVGGAVKSGAGPHDAPVLATHKSVELSALLYELGKMSDNFYAETVFKTLAGEKKGRPRAHGRLERRRGRSGSAKSARSIRAWSSRTARASSTRTA